jgi:hypothetical protein
MRFGYPAESGQASQHRNQRPQSPDVWAAYFALAAVVCDRCRAFDPGATIAGDGAATLHLCPDHLDTVLGGRDGKRVGDGSTEGLREVHVRLPEPCP